MMNEIRRLILLFIITLIPFTFTGCWGIREMNEIGIITATGVDVEPGGGVRITVFSMQPVGNIENPAQRSIAWIGSATGKSLMDASKNLRSISSRNLVWFQNDIVIVGEEMAKVGTREINDFILRNREIRLTGFILVTEGKAMDLMQVPADIQSNLYYEIAGILQNANEYAKFYASNIKDYIVSTAVPTQSCVIGKIGYYNTSMNTFSVPREEYEKLYFKDAKLGVSYLYGSAVMKDSKMAGWLNGEETRGFLWITDKNKAGTVSVKSSNGDLSMEIMDLNRKIFLDNANGKITFTVKINVRGNLSIYTAGGAVEEDKEDYMEKLFEEALINEMSSVVKIAQDKYKADIFGFGTYLFERHPDLWRNIKDDWENIFPEVDVKYDVKVTLKRIGMVTGQAGY